jgi:hypothetical protein
MEACATRAAASDKKTKQKDEPEDVMLTTMTRSGIEMPLRARKTPNEPTGGRRKKQKVGLFRPCLVNFQCIFVF